MKLFQHPWIVVLVLGALAVSCGSSGGPDAASDANEANQKPAAVRVVPSKMDTIRPTFETVGTLVPVPERVVVLSSQVPGQIARLNVEEGASVDAGTVVMELDTRVAQAELAKTRAALDEARANLALLERGSRPEEIEAARQDALDAEAGAQAAQSKLEALKPLYDKGEISPVQYQQGKSSMESAKALSAAAAARRRQVEAGARPEALQEARAKVASAEAGVHAQELLVQMSTITSPIAGVLTELPVRQGMYVQPGSTVATIMDVSTIFVQFRVPMVHLSQVAIGAGVELTAASQRDETFPATLVRLARQADPTTGDVTGFAEVANPDGELRPGLGCQIRVDLPPIDGALIVPVAAVADRDGAAVVTVIKDGKAYETEVEVGVRTKQVVQIVKGISPGDLVAIEGGYGLPEACPVRIVEDSQSADSDTSSREASGTTVP